MDLLADNIKIEAKKKYGWLASPLKIGCIGFGGGSALIPVMEQEAVQKDKLIRKEEYDEDVIVASITPGAFTVKMSAAIGRRIMGTKGMLLGALCMALPGFLATVLMLSVLSRLDDRILKQVEYVSIGITAFILTGLFQYVTGTWKERKESGKALSAGIIILCVFFLTGEKNIYHILEMSREPFFAVSTIHILLVSFFIIFYTNCSFHIVNSVLSIAIGLGYLICVGNTTMIDSLFICRVLQISMVLLSIYGIIKHAGRTDQLKKVSAYSLKSEIGTWMLFLLVTSLPAVMLYSGIVEFVRNGLLSCIMSYGGGDAYLTIADGMFVSNGIVSNDEFYGHLVLIANALPGSILCKILSGIGYYVGYGISGSIAAGYVVAFTGLSCSIAASCAMFSLGTYIVQKFENIETFQILRQWIRTILSGLLINVMLSLMYQCIKVAKSNRFETKWIVLFLLCLFIGNIEMNKRKVSMGFRILILSVTALLYGNILM